MSETAIGRLHPKVRELVTQLGWELTPIQEEATIDLCNVMIDY